MWTWGKQWMRVPASRGPTATTLTWSSPMTTWTRPLRRYRPPWTNCAVNPSGSQWTGCTEDQQQPLSGSHWPISMCVCVSDHKGQRREEKGRDASAKHKIKLKKNIIKKNTTPTALSPLRPARHATFFLLKTQRERVLIYFITFYGRSFYSVWNSSENETNKQKSGHALGPYFYINLLL